MSDYRLKTPAGLDKAIETYEKIRDGVVDTYEKIEDTVVGTYQKIEEKFVDTFLENICIFCPESYKKSPP